MPDRADRATAKTGPTAAHLQARCIADPWYRCQALARVAFQATDETRFNLIVTESLKAALDAENPYRCVAVSAWPIRALIERGRGEKAS